MGHRQISTMITGLFEDQALLIGGLVAEYSIDDAFVWRLMRNLDALRRRALAAIPPRKRRPARRSRTTPHPAVQEFLSRLGHGPATRTSRGET